MDVGKWWQIAGMRDLFDVLGANEGLTRFVGGTVRDELIGVPGSDVDLATQLVPQEVVRRLESAGIKAVPTGIDHGTVTAVSKGQVVEVTTLRRDVSTDGRRATVAYTTDWAKDAARRDFTINALFADPVSGEIFDYFNGLADLRERCVRFIGDPLQRIAEDHLRILRFFRFHARFGGGEPDTAALEACALRANDLMALSRERIADEMLKLLNFPDPVATVEIMVDRGILMPVLPEVDEAGVRRLEQLVSAEIQAQATPSPLRRLAALIPREAQAAEKIAARLKLSNKARKRLACAASIARSPNPQELAYRLGTDCAVDQLLLDGRSAEAAEIAHWPVPRLPLSGGDLIARGVPQGPQVATALRRVEEAWIAAGFPSGETLDRLVAEALS